MLYVIYIYIICYMLYIYYMLYVICYIYIHVITILALPSFKIRAVKGCGIIT